MPDLDRRILNILTIVGVISGILVFAVMFGILSYVHFTDAKRSREKLLEEKKRSAKISSALETSGVLSSPSSSPRQDPATSSSFAGQGTGFPTLSRSEFPGPSSMTLQVPGSSGRRMSQSAAWMTLGNQKSSDSGNFGSQGARSKPPSVYAIGTSVAAFKMLLNNRNRVPTTQDRHSHPMEEIELSR